MTTTAPSQLVLQLQDASARPARRPAKRAVPNYPVQTITINQLEKLLFGINGAKAVTVLAQTKVEMRKTGNRFHNLVYKTQEYNLFLNFNYTNAVNRQRSREDKRPDFVASPRKWGERLPNSCLIYHKGQYYMEAKVEAAGSRQYSYRGRPIDYAMIQEFCPEKARPRQGLDQDIIVRDFSALSVLEIVIDKVRYRVREESRRRRRREIQRAAAAQLVAAAQLATAGHLN